MKVNVAIRTTPNAAIMAETIEFSHQFLSLIVSWLKNRKCKYPGKRKQMGTLARTPIHDDI
jgi:hypothetical protein